MGEKGKMEESACKFWTKMKILSQIKKGPETTLTSSFAARIVNAIVVIPELQQEILFLIHECLKNETSCRRLLRNSLVKVLHNYILRNNRSKETLILALEILISVMEMHPRARADFSDIQGEKDLFALFRCMSQKFGKNSMSGTNQDLFQQLCHYVVALCSNASAVGGNFIKITSNTKFYAYILYTMKHAKTIVTSQTLDGVFEVFKILFSAEAEQASNGTLELQEIFGSAIIECLNSEDLSNIKLNFYLKCLMVLAKRNPQCLNQIHVLKPIINLLGAEFEESSYELLHQICLLIATAREFPAAKFLTDQRPVQRRIQELLDSPSLPRKIEIFLHRYLVKEEPDSTSNSEAEQNSSEKLSEGTTSTGTIESNEFHVSDTWQVVFDDELESGSNIFDVSDKIVSESDDDEAENEDLIEFKKPRPKFFSKYKFNDENKSILSETSGGTSPSIISEKSDSGSETSTSHSSRYNF